MEMALLSLDVKARFRADVPRRALLDIVEATRAARSQAAKNAALVGLTGRAATALTGYQTHKVMEKRLAALALAYGGLSLDGGLFPGTTLRGFQVLAKFGGVLIARASIVESRALPTRCATRINGSTINWPFSGQRGLFPQDPGADPQMFALLVTCRDKEVRGKFHELAIALIEPDYSGYILYEDADSFIAGYDAGEGHASTTGTPPMPPSSGSFNIILRNPSKPFEGGESPKQPDEEGDGGVS